MQLGRNQSKQLLLYILLVPFQVVFTKIKTPYKDLHDKLRMFIMIPRYGIYVEDEDIKDGYEMLLEHRCQKCKNEPPFKDFRELRLHIQKHHDLYSCDLCVEHIKVKRFKKLTRGLVEFN